MKSAPKKDGSIVEWCFFGQKKVNSAWEPPEIYLPRPYTYFHTQKKACISMYVIPENPRPGFPGEFVAKRGLFGAD